MFLHSIYLLLCGCTKKPVIDPDFIAPNTVTPKVYKRENQSIPKYWLKKVSVSISCSASVKQIIQEMAHDVGTDIAMDDIQDIVGITYTAKNTPFIVAIKKICRLANWKIAISESGDISISRDGPYYYTHEVAFLSVLRKIKLSSNINTVNKNENDGIAVETENTLDLWNEIETNLLFLLGNDKSKYSLNKQGGMILIKATQAEHEKVAEFLDALHDRVTAQVLVEAKIVEVILKDKYRNGIEWDLANIYNADRTGMFEKPVAIFESMSNSMNFLAEFGETRTISNPRAVVLNNQHAVFKEVTNNVYYKLTSSPIPIKDPNRKQHESAVALSSAASIVPTGIILVVHPSIDFNTLEITLSIKPVISGVAKVEVDPAVSILGGKVNGGMPVVKEKTIETVVRVKSHRVAILGGLTSGEIQPGIFGLNNGRFVANSSSHEKRELVMAVTAILLKGKKRKYHNLSNFAIRTCGGQS